MNLPRNCRRCNGRIVYDVIDGEMDAACIACGRSPFKKNPDRTPPELAELVENSLIRPNRSGR